jgi:phage shock protein C
MYKKLFRSSHSRIIAGVCGGLGEYFSIDPVIFRLITFFTTLIGGAGLIFYIVAWIVIPLEPVNK